MTQLKTGPKTLTDTLSKKIHSWQISNIKDASYHMSSGKCKLKQQWNTTTYLLEWPKSRKLTTPSTSKDVEQQGLLFIAGGSTKWHSHFGRQFGSFLQN